MKETLSKKETTHNHRSRCHHRNHCSGSGYISETLQIWASALPASCVITSGALGLPQCSCGSVHPPGNCRTGNLAPAFLLLLTKEFKPRGGSAPVTRFVIGMFVMIGCLDVPWLPIPHDPSSGWR